MKQLIRNFKKQKTVGSLSIISLALGTMVAILVGLWVINELSFDNFFNNGDRIYRVTTTYTNSEKVYKAGAQGQPIGLEIKATIPEVEAMVRAVAFVEEVWVDNLRHPDVKGIAADSTFFQFFGFPLKVGDPKTVLSSPHQLVLDEDTGKKLFPNQDPIGKIVRIGKVDLRVTGIMYNMPRNSHLQSGIVTTFFGNYDDQDRWDYSDIYLTYLRLSKNANINELAKKITGIAYSNSYSYKAMNAGFDLQPLQEIHWDSTVEDRNIAKGSMSLLTTFGIVAAVILLLACINFSNLFTSSAFLRAKTIGIQQSQGADRGILIKNFYAETAGYVAISIGIGLLLALLAEPLFKQFVDTNFRLTFTDPMLYAFLAVLLVVTVLLAGSLPALYITKLRPIETLGGKYKGKRTSSIQKALVVVQFTASIALLIVSMFISNQVTYMLTRDLGFNKDNIIYVYKRGDFAANMETLQNELMNEPSIVAVTAKNSLPTEWVQGWTVKTEGLQEDYLTEICRVKPNYFDVMGMTFVEGENPFTLAGADSLSYCVVNESLVRQLQLSQPIGKTITMGSRTATIHGVIRDAHVRSFHQKNDPQVYIKHAEGWRNVLLVKVQGDPQKAIAALENQWNKVVQDAPFEYHFLNEAYEALYKSEKNLQSMLLFAMIIGFAISVAGLFAMAFYNTQRRIKEVAVRKVNGAETAGLIVLLNKEFLTWVLISFALACPISYYAIEKWLESFTIQAALSIWVFISVGLVAMLVAIVTVSWQVWQAATTNPVDVVKRE